MDKPNGKDKLIDVHLTDSKYSNESESMPPAQLKKNYITVCYLGFVFMLLFSAYNTAQNMISEIYSQKLDLGYLGKLTLLVVYLVLGSSNIFAGSIMEKLSFKSAMFISAFGYVLFLGAGATACACEHEDNEPMPSYFFCHESVIVLINIICAAILGFLACIIWVAQPEYTTKLCDSASKAKFFGVFWALVQSSQILGNVFSAIVLQYCSHLVYFGILFFVALGSTFLFLFLPHVPKTHTVQKSIKEKLSDFFSLCKVREMQIFSIFCCFSGMITGFYAGFLFEIVKDCLTKAETDDDSVTNQKTAYVFICLGVFEFIGGMFVSKIGDKIDKYVMAVFSNIVIEFALFFSLIGHYQKHYLLCFFAAACWGAGECIANSIIVTILSSDLGNKLEGFAIFKLTQSFGVLIALLLSIILDGQNPFIYILILTVFQAISTISVVSLRKKN